MTRFLGDDLYLQPGLFPQFIELLQLLFLRQRLGVRLLQCLGGFCQPSSIAMLFN